MNDLWAWWNSVSRIFTSSHIRLHAVCAWNHLTLFAANIFRSESYEKTDVCLLSICHSASSTGERLLGLPTIQYHRSSVFASLCAAGAFLFLHHRLSLSSGCNNLSSAERPSARRAVRTHWYLSAVLTLSFERLKRERCTWVLAFCPWTLSVLNFTL